MYLWECVAGWSVIFFAFFFRKKEEEETCAQEAHLERAGSDRDSSENTEECNANEMSRPHDGKSEKCKPRLFKTKKSPTRRIPLMGTGLLWFDSVE
jgi:hypothetical protein